MPNKWKQECWSCTHYKDLDPLGHDSGECRCIPPIANVPGDWAIFPPVKASCYCGKYEIRIVEHETSVAPTEAE